MLEELVHLVNFLLLCTISEMGVCRYGNYVFLLKLLTLVEFYKGRLNRGWAGFMLHNTNYSKDKPHPFA